VLVTLAHLQTLEANRRALVAEYGEDRIRAMHDEMTSLSGAALQIEDEYQASEDEHDKRMNKRWISLSSGANYHV
jgi:hypothetical protein